MTAFIIRKLLQVALLIVVVLVVNFLILRLTPGNPYDAQQLTLLENNTGRDLTSYQQYQLSLLKKRLDIYFLPFPEAFAKWAGGIVRFDFGDSVITGLNITEGLLDSALSSLWLFLLATGFGITLGTVLGLYAAYHPGSWQDNTVKIVTLVFIALPGWYMYSVINKLNLQISQFTGVSILPTCQGRNCQTLASSFFLPIFLLGSILLAVVWGQTRTQGIAVLRQDYIRTAHSKGLRRQRILFWHVFRNSLTPIVSIFGGLLPFVFASQILIEISAKWQGLGAFFLSAANLRDYTSLMGVFTLLVLVCVLCSFLSEVTLAALDPKLREQYQGGVRLARLTKSKEGQPYWWRRPITIGVGLAIVAIGIAGFVAFNPLADKAVAPNTNNTSQNITATVGTTPQVKIIYEALKLPSDAKILQTEVKVDERPPVVTSLSSSGAPTGQPAFNKQVETQQIIFGTNVRNINMTIEIRKALEADGWVASTSYKNYATNIAIDYVFEKGDKLLWLSSFDLSGNIGQKNWELFKANYPNASRGLGQRLGDKPNTIAAVIQGYKAGKSPTSISNP